MENILSSLVALGGLAVGAITIFLSHREKIKTRTSPYREALYAKQVVSISDLINSFQATSISSEALSAALMQNDKEVIAHFVKELEEKLRETFDLIVRISPFVSNSVMNAATGYLEPFTALIELAETDDHSSLGDLLQIIRTSEFTLTLESRKMLGTDALTEETLKLFEKSGLPNYPEIQNYYIKNYESHLKST